MYPAYEVLGKINLLFYLWNFSLSSGLVNATSSLWLSRKKLEATPTVGTQGDWLRRAQENILGQWGNSVLFFWVFWWD
jgi:hypothetical protein